MMGIGSVVLPAIIFALISCHFEGRTARTILLSVPSWSPSAATLLV